MLIVTYKILELKSKIRKSTQVSEIYFFETAVSKNDLEKKSQNEFS